MSSPRPTGGSWDADAWSFLDGQCPDTANPSLWRQSRLCARQGLYQVTEGIYQVRGLDLSNMTIVEGDTGIVVVDPLLSVETAAAALGLYRAHRGDRPVTGLIYSHSHADHFGGAAGVTDGDVPILAPVGFMEHAVAENVYAGTAMTRRASFMYGATLPVGPSGLIGFGLGNAASSGTVSVPAHDRHHLHRAGGDRRRRADRVPADAGHRSALGDELPVPRPPRPVPGRERHAHHAQRAHPRGALVRDARIWSRYITEAITMFDGAADVVFASHHWPTWGQDNMTRYLTEQRDLYAYLHDQTLRLANQGHNATEIAEMIQLPPALDAAWHARGYYGTVSHNVKAVYQRYLGWFDGNPANLWQHPPVETAKRYVDCLGGVDAVVSKARDYADAGDLRFAAQLLQHAVFADPAHGDAKELLAQVYEKLGHGAESGIWRNFYLTGAQELRHGPDVTPVDLGGGMAAVLSIEQIFDTLAIRVDAPKAWHDTIVIDWTFTDLGQSYRTTLRNGVLVQQQNPPAGNPELSLTLTKPQLLGMLAGKGLGGIAHDGDLDGLRRMQGYLDAPDPRFAIVTP
ncbi:alkyl/aryl-sulfatase [Catellatospora coxensis]